MAAEKVEVSVDTISGVIAAMQQAITYLEARGIREKGTIGRTMVLPALDEAVKALTTGEVFMFPKYEAKPLTIDPNIPPDFTDVKHSDLASGFYFPPGTGGAV